jgi:hypothetical protein
MITTGAPICGDDPLADRPDNVASGHDMPQELTHEENPPAESAQTFVVGAVASTSAPASTSASEPSSGASTTSSATTSTATTVFIVVPPGYTLDPVWDQVDADTRAAALSCASAMLSVGLAAGKTQASDAELRCKLLDVQRQLAEQKLQHASSLSAEREKMESEVNFLKKDLGQAVARIGESVGAAFGRHSTAKDKGEIGETLVEKWICEWFPSCTIAKCGAGHSADYLVTIPAAAHPALRILLEVKNKMKVQTSDVEQFERDVAENRLGVDAAIFVSLRCARIPGRGEMQIASIGRTVVAYLGGHLEQQSRDVKIVVDALRQFIAREKAATDWELERTKMISSVGRTLKILRDAETRAQKATKAAIALQQDVSFLTEAIIVAVGHIASVGYPLPAVTHGKTKVEPGKLVRGSASVSARATDDPNPRPAVVSDNPILSTLTDSDVADLLDSI